jgi:hypothetical protein
MPLWLRALRRALWLRFLSGAAWRPFFWTVRMCYRKEREVARWLRENS